MTQDEIAVMDGGKCICQIRGVRPFLSAKYDITRHPRYKYLSDAKKENTFNVEKYLSRMRKPRPPVAPDEPFDFYDLDETGDPGETPDAPEDADAIREIDGA
jgi:type IV secretion system protein VirD4